MCLCSCDNFTFNITFGSGNGFPSWETDFDSDSDFGSDFDSYVEELCPTDIKNLVVEYANKYKEADTEYEYGGQDPLKAIKIDCSGLVIRCYSYALEGTDYKLIQPDMNTSYLYQTATNPITEASLEPGDLVFMGDADSDEVNHVGIYTRKFFNKIYFIDSTSITNPTGVSERNYDKNNAKIKGYGQMRLKRKI